MDKQTPIPNSRHALGHSTYSFIDFDPCPCCGKMLQTRKTTANERIEAEKRARENLQFAIRREMTRRGITNYIIKEVEMSDTPRTVAMEAYYSDA